jgi:microcystin-dependent protein
MAETLTSGLTITIPSEGDENWAESIKDSCFAVISAHDHTGGGDGVQIATAAIADGAITLAKLDPSIGVTLVPAGTIMATARSSAPSGYLLCDGSAVSRTLYADLFSAISTTYGAGNGSTTFNIPNLQGRFPLGKATSGTGSTLGGTGGAIDHTHTVPAHHHAMGTGADLNITSSGTHTTSITHDHAQINSGALLGGALGDTTFGGASVASGGSFETLQLGGGASRSNIVTVNLPEFSGNSSSDGAHTHASGNVAGRIGLVTGGVDGNASMTSGANNPPYVVVNYMIKT